MGNTQHISDLREISHHLEIVCGRETTIDKGRQRDVSSDHLCNNVSGNDKIVAGRAHKLGAIVVALFISNHGVVSMDSSIELIEAAVEFGLGSAVFLLANLLILI